MRIEIDILVADVTDRPPPGAAVIARLEDVAEMDAPAIRLGEARTLVAEDVSSPRLASLVLDWDGQGQDVAVSVLVDVDGDGAVGKGDFITMRHYGVGAGVPLAVVVKRV